MVRLTSAPELSTVAALHTHAVNVHGHVGDRVHGTGEEQFRHEDGGGGSQTGGDRPEPGENGARHGHTVDGVVDPDRGLDLGEPGDEVGEQGTVGQERRGTRDPCPPVDPDDQARRVRAHAFEPIRHPSSPVGRGRAGRPRVRADGQLSAATTASSPSHRARSRHLPRGSDSSTRGSRTRSPGSPISDSTPASLVTRTFCGRRPTRRSSSQISSSACSYSPFRARRKQSRATSSAVPS